MGKVIKYTSIGLSLILLSLILVLISFITFVNPNRLKPLIAERAHQYLGRSLTIEGNVAWTFFPYLGIKADHLILSNFPPFQTKPLAEIDLMTFKVKLLPWLLHKKMESSGIALQGLHVYLQRNKDGVVNWQGNNPSEPHAALTVTSNAPQTKNPNVAWVLAHLDITQSTISFIDEQKNQTFTADAFELHAQDMQLLKPFPLTVNFDFKSKKPHLAGKVVFGSQCTLQALRNPLSFSEIDLALTLNNQKTYQVKGDVSLSTALVISGLLNIDHLEMRPLHLKNVTVPFIYHDRLLTIKSLKATVEQGSLEMMSTLQFNKERAPTITLKGQLTQVPIASLLQDLNRNKQQLGIAGIGDVQFQMVKNDSNELSGLLHFNIKNGLVKGFDLNYLIDKAHAFIKGKEVKKPDLHQTEFAKMEGTFVLQKGILHNDDLMIYTPRFTIKGHGLLQVPNHKIDYYLQLFINPLPHQKHGSDNLYGVPVPFILSGTSQNPVITMDTQVLANDLLSVRAKKIKIKKTDLTKAKDLIQQFLR